MKVGEIQFPVLVFDGECPLCRWWVNRWRHLTCGSVRYVPFQDLGQRGFLGVAPEAFAKAVHYIESPRQISTGAEAAFRLLNGVGGWRRTPLWLYRRVPGVAPFCEAMYRHVSRHRPALDRVRRAIVGDRTTVLLRCRCGDGEG
ncbi:MAG: DUF393 domain-containing protein [Sumerlaeia bacterium]